MRTRDERDDSRLPAAGREWVVELEVAGQHYSLPADATDEILHMVELSRPPSAPPFLAGFLNLGGTAVPVIRLAELFGVEGRQPELYTPLIVLRTSGGRIALWVDRVRDVRLIRTSEILPIPHNHSLNNCAQGLVKTSRDFSLLLDPERLLLEGEQARLAHLGADEQKRLGELEEVIA